MSNLTEDIKPLKDLSDRELQEWIYRMHTKNEKHLKYLCSAATFYIVLTCAGIAIAFILAANAS